MGNGIFICYRPEEEAFAKSIRDRLKAGRLNIFMDVKNSIELADVLPRCDTFLVLIGKDWANACDEHQKRLLDDSHDWVRIEIEEALKRNDVKLIPLLIEEAPAPKIEELPDAIKGLAYRQFVKISFPSIDYDIQRLIPLIKWIEPPATTQRTTHRWIILIIVVVLIFLLLMTSNHQY